MNDKIPEPLRIVVEQLSRLPGLGPKSAMRAAMTLLKWPESETRRLGRSVHDLRDNLCLCQHCGGLTATSPCTVCADTTREKDTLCLVSEWDSMLTLEEGAFFRGQYLILGGLLQAGSSNTDNLDIDRLLQRLRQGEVQELVLALGATLEADTTGAYVRNLVHKNFPHIKISRLAQGIPLGAEVKFMDRETLRQSLQYRQQL